MHSGCLCSSERPASSNSESKRWQQDAGDGRDASPSLFRGFHDWPVPRPSAHEPPSICTHIAIPPGPLCPLDRSVVHLIARPPSWSPGRDYVVRKLYLVWFSRAYPLAGCGRCQSLLASRWMVWRLHQSLGLSCSCPPSEAKVERRRVRSHSLPSSLSRFRSLIHPNAPLLPPVLTLTRPLPCLRSFGTYHCARSPRWEEGRCGQEGRS